MIKNSVAIMRGCSVAALLLLDRTRGPYHPESLEDSIVREIEAVRDKTRVHGVITDLGGPTANMYRLACKDPRSSPRVGGYPAWPGDLSQPQHRPCSLVGLYRRARQIKGVKKIHHRLGSLRPGGESPEYVEELSSTTWAAI